MNKPLYVALIGTCPHCKEPVELVISKRQAKLIFKAFKLPTRQAQLYSEKELEKLQLRKRT